MERGAPPTCYLRQPLQLASWLGWPLHTSSPPSAVPGKASPALSTRALPAQVDVSPAFQGPPSPIQCPQAALPPPCLTHRRTPQPFLQGSSGLSASGTSWALVFSVKKEPARCLRTLLPHSPSCIYPQVNLTVFSGVTPRTVSLGLQPVARWAQDCAVSNLGPEKTELRGVHPVSHGRPNGAHDTCQK